MDRPCDFTGYWQLRKADGLDGFLRELGFPWVIRKAALKFGCSAIDLVWQSGTEVRVSSLNAKGSWTRTYDTAREVQQRNAEGAPCKTTAWWEGRVLRTRVEGSPLGICESSRYMRGDAMVVKTTVLLAAKAGGGAGNGAAGPGGEAAPREATVFWLFDRHKVLESHLGAGGRGTLMKQLAADQKRVAQATRKDNRYLQALLLDFERWASPADEFITVAAPSYVHSRPRLRSGVTPGGSPRALSPAPMSKSASAASLSALEARSMLPPGTSAASLEEAGSAARQHSRFTRDISLAHHEDAAAAGGSQPSSRTPSPMPGGPAPDSDATGRSGSMPPMPPAHRHTASGEGLPAGRALHHRTGSMESRGLSPPDGRSTPLRGTPPQQGAPSGGEALLVYKLQEFRDGRGISSVVPVSTPNDTSEPQLLGMSPEQAEETAAKLRELEEDMLLRRQEGSRGFACCGLVIASANSSLPDWLRVWESSMLI